VRCEHSVTAAERIHVRAFARTSSTAPVGTGTVAIQRFAYTNPIWVRPVFGKTFALGTKMTAAALR
jgi:hypothetical protein